MAIERMHADISGITKLEDLPGYSQKPSREQDQLLYETLESIMASGVFTEEMRQREEEDQLVYAETGLPGSKITADGQTWYIHGLIHPAGISVLSSFSHRSPALVHDVQQCVKKWSARKSVPSFKQIGDGSVDRDEIYLEQHLKQAFGVRGSDAIEGKEMDYVRSLYDIRLLPLAVQLQYEAMLRLLKIRKKSEAMDVPKGGIPALLEFRKKFRQIPEPFVTQAGERLFPVRNIERSIVLFQQARRAFGYQKTVHIVTGLGHESHLRALFALHPNREWVDTVHHSMQQSELQREKEAIFEYYSRK